MVELRGLGARCSASGLPRVPKSLTEDARLDLGVFGLDLRRHVLELALRARDEEDIQALARQLEGVRLADTICVEGKWGWDCVGIS